MRTKKNEKFDILEYTIEDLKMHQVGKFRSEGHQLFCRNYHNKSQAFLKLTNKNQTDFIRSQKCLKNQIKMKKYNFL